MSSNNINILNQKYLNKTNIYVDSKKDVLKKNKNSIANNFDKKFISTQDKINSINLENSYKNTLILLEMIEKQTEKNIFKKYKIENNIKEITNSNNSKDIHNILMKKKFLTIPL
ncbi:hypothetical protein D9V68_02995 [Buchnera aphidicola (Hyperomyzus lactucae)]|uniref:Uncharacterized protein n=1 Tax=Buchnera aphidicola (Hyperomyzus lactucae) TaxID=1241860 RepID=A0A4D6XYP6_9GAMM|nr:hypothetical protein [Buchnera aphidicola]QCI21287.1 hypothetical protein D9V68_02995 [Buchnera aphidicola (Hyperomyzus lactucae)]